MPMKYILTLLTALTVALPGAVSAAEVQKAEMAGYLLVSSDKVPDAYCHGALQDRPLMGASKPASNWGSSIP
jgi:hypothetical protein